MSASTSTARSLRSLHLQRRAYLPVLLTWLATRVFALACMNLTPRLLDDIDVYRTWLPLLRSGAFPVADDKWQYPPGVGPVLLAPDLLPVNYAVAFVLLCVVVDAAIMIMLLTAHARRPDRSAGGLRVWAVAAVVVGPIMYVRFDIVPTLFAVACVLLVGRPAWAGATAAMGFVVKLWPGLMLLALPRARTRRGVLAFVASTALMLLLIAWGFTGSLSFLANQRARGLQVESVGALPYELFSLVHGEVAYGLQYGSTQVLMSGAELVGTVISVLGIGLLVLLAWWRLSGRLDTAAPGDVALTAVLVMVATSRVYSPQFNIWIIGVAAAALLSSRTRMTTVARIMIGVSLLTQVIYPWFPFDLTDGNPPVVAAQCLRIIGLLIATGLALRALASPGTSDREDQPAR